MTDNEIIKALECCKGEAIPCSECIYADFGQCQTYMADDALKLIKRQQAEIDDLQDELTCYKETNKHLNDEYGVLSRECDRLKEQIESLESRIFALNDTNKILMETQKVYTNNKLKEFAEEFEKRCIASGIYPALIKNILKNLVKELTEGSND